MREFRRSHLVDLCKLIRWGSRSRFASRWSTVCDHVTSTAFALGCGRQSIASRVVFGVARSEKVSTIDVRQRLATCQPLDTPSRRVRGSSERARLWRPWCPSSGSTSCNDVLAMQRPPTLSGCPPKNSRCSVRRECSLQSVCRQARCAGAEHRNVKNRGEGVAYGRTGSDSVIRFETRRGVSRS